MRSLACRPALAAGVSSIGDTTLMTPFSMRDLDAEAAELAAGLHLHVAVVFGRHVGGVRVERGEHAVDGTLDHRAFVGLLDVVLADTFEDFAEQIDLAVDVRVLGRGGLQIRDVQDCRRAARHRPA